MTMALRRVRDLLLAGLVLCTSTGCWFVVGAAGGAAGAVYVMGQLKDRLDAPVAQVHDAAVAALKDLGLPIKEDKTDKLSAHVESEFADGQHVWITIEAEGEAASKITIRVGMVGDEAKSRKILDTLNQHLKGHP